MSEATNDLAARLELRERELAAIRSLDREADRANGVEELLSSAAGVVTTLLRADLVRIVSPAGDWLPEATVVREQWKPADEAAIGEALRTSSAKGEDLTLAVDGGEILFLTLASGSGHPGTIVAGRRAGRWSAGERELLGTIREHLGHALGRLRILRELAGRRREIETILRLDRLIDESGDFEQTLSAALGILSESVGAEWSFIMLFDAEGKELELRAASHDEVGRLDAPVGESLRAHARETIAAGRLVRRHGLAGPVASFLGLPLILEGEIIGVFGGGNPSGRPPFGPAEAAMLEGIGSQMDSAIFEDRQLRHIRQTFSRYVSPGVVDLMLATPDHDYMRVRRAPLTMLFSDMRGFTSVSERLEADVVAAMLNEHLAAMTEVIRDAGGTVDKFVGDEVVAFFGAPVAREDHPLAAVRTAIAMQARHRQIMDGWAARGLPRVQIGIGVGSGEVIVGNIGSEQMMNYTVIGREVNLAARLCGAADGGQILLAEPTWRRVEGKIRAHPIAPLELRHIAHPVQAFAVDGEA